MRHCLWLILVTVFLTVFGCETTVFGQRSVEFPPLQERMTTGPVVLDDENFFCYWPSWQVTESSVTAIELSTGRHLWSKPANLALPLTYRIDEGWLQYETTDGEQVSARRTNGRRTFHLVHSTNGQERTYPAELELRSIVDQTWVHRDHCLTPQGLVVRCSDGAMIGYLGPGEHQTLVTEGLLFATTLVPDVSNTHFEKRLLRRFNLKTMEVEREMELPLENGWRIVAARADLVVGKSEVPNRTPLLVCVNIDEKKNLWSTSIPISVRTSPFEWIDDSELILTMGIHGQIRPMKVNLTTGAVFPDRNWHDPRLLLAWHQESGHYPDFVAYNEKFIVGQWRYFELSCVDSQTGEIIWNHGTSKYVIGRIFSSPERLGDYLIAESKEGFDIVSVAKGDRLAITPAQVGLKINPKRLMADDEEAESVSAPSSLFGDSSQDWLWDQGLLLGPLIPIVGWMFWSAVRR